jgi:hypothetical protein
MHLHNLRGRLCVSGWLGGWVAGIVVGSCPTAGSWNCCCPRTVVRGAPSTTWTALGRRLLCGQSTRGCFLLPHRSPPAFGTPVARTPRKCCHARTAPSSAAAHASTLACLLPPPPLPIPSLAGKTWTPPESCWPTVPRLWWSRYVSGCLCARLSGGVVSFSCCDGLVYLLGYTGSV